MTKHREVYAEKCDSILALNPYVDMPRLRVSEFNKLTELIDRNIPKLLIPIESTSGYVCPTCGRGFSKNSIIEYKFCYECGQRFSLTETDF